MSSFTTPAAGVFTWLVALALGVGGFAREAAAQPLDFRVVETFGDTREVTCVATSTDTLWAGTLGGGMVRLRGAITTDAASREHFGAHDGLPGQRVRDCALAERTLWVATDAGLARWDEAARRFALVQAGRFLRVSSAGSQLMAADAHGVLWKLGPHGTFVAAARTELSATALALSNDGARWVLGGMNGKLVSNDASLPRTGPADASGRLEPIEALSFRGDTLLIGSASQPLRSPAALPDTPQGARATAHGRFGELELLATDRGLFAYAPGASTWQAVGLGADLPCGDRIAALAVHRGALYVGSFDRGLCRYDGTTFTRFSAPNDLPSDMVNDLASDGERLYVATARGLAVLDERGVFHSYVHGACTTNLQGACPWFPSVNGVAVDVARKQTWIADRGALHRILKANGSTWQHRAGSAFGSDQLTRLAVHAGQLALGTSDAGVLLGRSDEKRIGSLTRFDHQSGLADDWVTDLTFDARGALWIATCTRGLSVRESSGALHTLTEDDGLSDDYVLSVNELDGLIWVGTLRGLSVLRVDDAWHVKDVQRLDARSGLSGDEVHDAVRWNDRIWLATDGGLSVLRSYATQHTSLAGDASSTPRYAP